MNGLAMTLPVAGYLNTHFASLSSLRLAMGIAEITTPCLEAAFRFCEWQQRLRQVFKPGLAETKDAQAFEAVWKRLKEQFNRQNSDHGSSEGGAPRSRYGPGERWKLITSRMS